MLDLSVLASLGLTLDEQQSARLSAFHRLLLQHNKAMDLTTVPEEEMTLRHYADSLLVLRRDLISPSASLVDVGSGPGFPALPLPIARPDLRITLLDSRQKRCAFLQAVIDTLKLPGVSILCGRAEELALSSNREAFDYAVARAVAPLNVLAEYLLPFVRPGGQALCWKGPAVHGELEDGRHAARLLGGRMGALVDLGIPGRSHYVQIIHKISATPKQYPRKAGMPGKDPLRLNLS